MFQNIVREKKENEQREKEEKSHIFYSYTPCLK